MGPDGRDDTSDGSQNEDDGFDCDVPQYNPFVTNEKINFPFLDIENMGSQMDNPSLENDGEFRWSIDHLSRMYPVDMKYSGRQDQLDINDDEDAQLKSHQFFQNATLPSPWTPVGRNRRKSQVDHMISPYTTPQPKCFENFDSPPKKINPSKIISCQTDLTIPFDFDLKSLSEFPFNSFHINYRREEKRRIEFDVSMDDNDTSSVSIASFAQDLLSDSCVNYNQGEFENALRFISPIVPTKKRNRFIQNQINPELEDEKKYEDSEFHTNGFSSSE